MKSDRPETLQPKQFAFTSFFFLEENDGSTVMLTNQQTITEQISLNYENNKTKSS